MCLCEGVADVKLVESLVLQNWVTLASCVKLSMSCGFVDRFESALELGGMGEA